MSQYHWHSWVPSIKTDDESTHAAAVERRSGAMAESMWHRTFIISALDLSNENTPQGVIDG